MKNTPQIIEGNLKADGLKFALVVSRFNEFITGQLLDGAIDALIRHGATADSIKVCRVPGAFELPLAAQRLAAKGEYDAIVCLGALIRGSTSHYDLVAAEATKGIAQVSLANSLPVIFGVITVDTIEQAVERAGTKAGNKGFDAAVSAIEMANLFRSLDG